MTKKAPKPYQPAYQQQADQSYQSLITGMTPQAGAISNTVIPGLQQTATNVQNNPYAAQAQAGANTAAQMTPGLVNNQVAGSNQLMGLGGLAANAAPGIANMGAQAAQGAYAQGQDIYNQAQSQIPAAMAGQQYASGVFGDSMALRDMLGGMDATALQQALPLLMGGIDKANTAWGQTQSAIPGLTGGMTEAQTLLNNGFDPQSTLYNREFQQQQDQQNAINSMYGLSGSAYGAGTAGQANRDFNLDWGDRQLSRQIAALGSYGQHSGQVTQNLSNLLNTGASTYGSLASGAVNQYGAMTDNAADNFSNLTNTGVQGFNDLNNSAVANFNSLSATGMQGLNQGYDNFNNLLNSSVNNLDQLSTAAGRTLGQGSALGIDALNTLMTGTQAPSQQYLSDQQAQISALQALASGGSQALAPTQALVQAQGNYLNIGQNANQLAQQAANSSNAGITGALGGLGKLAGMAAGFAIGGPKGAALTGMLI